MTIEVRELIIKAQINSPNQQDSSQESRSDEDKRSLIEECVEQVLEILKEKEER